MFCGRTKRRALQNNFINLKTFSIKLVCSMFVLYEELNYMTNRPMYHARLTSARSKRTRQRAILGFKYILVFIFSKQAKLRFLNVIQSGNF